ncbi:hypothetical protein ACFLQL_00325 [Verrucomicrobiota bacterium]
MILLYPNGCQPPWDRDRKTSMYWFYNSETVQIRHTCYLPSGAAATLSNSLIDCTIRDQRFAEEIIWHGDLDEGITFVDEVSFPGLINIKLPDTVTTNLRRGSYIFSIMVADKTTHERKVAMEGMIMIEYASTSDIRDIPYRDPNWTG